MSMLSDTKPPSPVELLQQLQQSDAADLANEIAKTYEIVERVYFASLGGEPRTALSATTNSRS